MHWWQYELSVLVLDQIWCMQVYHGFNCDGSLFNVNHRLQNIDRSSFKWHFWFHNILSIGIDFCFNFDIVLLQKLTLSSNFKSHITGRSHSTGWCNFAFLAIEDIGLFHLFVWQDALIIVNYHTVMTGQRRNLMLTYIVFEESHCSHCSKTDYCIYLQEQSHTILQSPWTVSAPQQLDSYTRCEDCWVWQAVKGTDDVST